MEKPQTLSSDLTFASKVFIPLCYYAVVASFAFVLIQAALAHDTIEPKLWVYLLFSLAMGWLVTKVLGSLKRVRMDEGGLYVSNYLKETVVPFANIRSVEPSSIGDRWPRITVTFHTHTEFGERIVFLAKHRWTGWASLWRNPAESIARELRTAVVRATGKDPTAAA